MLRKLRAFVTGSPAACAEDCTACPAEPGSVTPHSHHVLVRLAVPVGAPPGASADVWWCEKVDNQPAIVAVNAALKERAAEIDGKVKVTAYDCSAAAKAAPQAIGTCDLLVFPACLRIARVPLEQAGAVAAAALVRNAAATLADGQERLTGPTFLVCCHRSRDARCGALGPPLVAALSALGAEVYLSSHVGGHKWAGNVIVYGIDHPAHGHWFGGLTARDAAAFAAALAALQPGDDPAGHPQLRAWWRGRSGMTKAEQMQHFKRCAQTGDIEDVAGKS